MVNSSVWKSFLTEEQCIWIQKGLLESLSLFVDVHAMLYPLFHRLKNAWYAPTKKQLFFFSHADTCVLVRVSSPNRTSSELS